MLSAKSQSAGENANWNHHFGEQFDNTTVEDSYTQDPENQFLDIWETLARMLRERYINN